ncbi:MAG: zinc ribbon domain-containing protein [Cyanobacteria bacterium P01_A01_bin.135]
MPNCPHCQHQVTSQAIACPACGASLKAFGHPGITLHQSTDGDYLCLSCAYHQDDTCNFPQRPYAKQCTLYEPPTEALEQAAPAPRQTLRSWLQRHSTALLWIGLVIICVLIALQ